MNPLLLQKQLKENADEMQTFCKDLKSWGDEMKRKEDNLKNIKPPKVRRAKAMSKGSKKGPEGKIGGTDYAAWDKFDVDAECERLDDDYNEDSELTDEFDDNVKEEAMLEKDKGNKFVKVQNWKSAIDCYTKAITLYAYDPIFYANRALCHLKLNEMSKAENDCNFSLKLDQTYVKAYQRRAAAREALLNFEGAKSDLLQVLQLEPNNKESKNQLEKLKLKLQEDKAPEEALQRPISHFRASRNKSQLTKSIPNQNTTINYQNQSNLSQSSDRIIVKPCQKPPHMRRKTPLKRIPIIETNALDKKMTVNEAIKSRVTENIQSMDEFLSTKNGHNFINFWNRSSVEQRCEIVSKMEPSRLEYLYNIEVKIEFFRELVDVLDLCCIKGTKLPVFSFLKYLLPIRNQLILNVDDKKAIRKLFVHSEDIEQVDVMTFGELMMSYNLL